MPPYHDAPPGRHPSLRNPTLLGESPRPVATAPLPSVGYATRVHGSPLMPTPALQRSTVPTVPLKEEQSVVARIQEGDRAAFAILYGWYGDAIYRVALRQLGDRVLAEDVLRDTFRRALEQISTFTYQGKSIYAWLHRIARHRATDHHRAQARHRRLFDQLQVEPLPAAPPPRPDREVEQAEAARDVALSLSQLNPRYAKVLRWRLLEGRSREECADALDITTNNLDVLFHRACKAFKKVYPP